MGDMFCFQCQQTAHNTGCEGSAGVCGKKADTANYQDDLVSALIGLARAVRKKGATEKSDELMLKGLFTTITNVNFYNDTICTLIDEVNKEMEAIDPQTDDYDVQNIWDDNEDIRSLKSLILFIISFIYGSVEYSCASRLSMLVVPSSSRTSLPMYLLSHIASENASIVALQLLCILYRPAPCIMQ